jgi:hypothetical protein
MVLVNHAQRIAQPLTRGQRRAIALIAVLLAGAAIAAAVASTSARSSGAGCVSVVVASTMGGQTLQRCGAQARSWCAAEFARSDPAALAVQARCRVAGIRPRGRPAPRST